MTAPVMTAVGLLVLLAAVVVVGLLAELFFSPAGPAGPPWPGPDHVAEHLRIVRGSG